MARCDRVDCVQTPVRQTSSDITFANRLDHFLARWGIKRNERRVDPGLYALGDPNPDSPVFVTANYRPSFDALRAALSGVACYIMVLDTRGINVWCAAGKGTFGTDELVRRIESTGLARIVNHRELILPQLSAPGVAAHDVESRSGYIVEYGPVRAEDLKAYLKTREATSEMRWVRFSLADRLALIPVELVQTFLPMAAAAIVLFLLGGPLASATAIVATLTGVVLFPILLPWIPTPNFSTKGLILGGAVSLPLVAAVLTSGSEAPLWQLCGWAAVCALAISSVTAFLALNFTGSTTFTSRSGVRKEIFSYIPVMAWMFGGSVVLAIALAVVGMLGHQGGIG